MFKYIVPSCAILAVCIYCFFAGFLPGTSMYAFKNPSNGLPKGFVYLKDIDPTIILSPRYAGCENCMGKAWNGYEKPVIILTEKAAKALKKAQEKFQRNGYSLVVYDGYRPQQAQDSFIKWVRDEKNQEKKESYFPRMQKNQILLNGFSAEKSSHSRGSAVDVTLIPLNHSVHPIIPHPRQLTDGATILYLDDGTLDMGTGLDLFDEASAIETPLLNERDREHRRYLRDTLESCGFEGFDKEWYHFSFKDEPFPDTSFTFPVK